METMNTPDPKNHPSTAYAPLFIYCFYVLISIYWGFPLLLALINVYVAQGPAYIALTALNILVFVLTSLLAFKIFSGGARPGLFIFFAIIAGLGMCWLNSTIPMPNLNF